MRMNTTVATTTVATINIVIIHVITKHFLLSRPPVGVHVENDEKYKGKRGEKRKEKKR